MHYLLLMLLLLSSPIALAKEPKIKMPTVSFFSTLYVGGNHSNSNAQNAAESNANLENTTTSSMMTDIAQRLHSINFQSGLESSKGWLQSGWPHIVFVFIVTSYGYAIHQLNNGVNYINDELKWAKWKENASFDELTATGIENLSKELIFEIQMNYPDNDNPGDFNSPLITFQNELKKEFTLLRKYQKIYAFVNKAHLLFAVPFSCESLKQIPLYQARLKFVKKTYEYFVACRAINR